MLVLSDAFAPNFNFKLIDTDRVSNTIWHSALDGYKEESDMKRALRRGNCASLWKSLLLISFWGCTHLGECTVMLLDLYPQAPHIPP